tara:strand:- start:328 stop:456 length:129 start_codon:yes stop_codon:yes gene_type:complete
MTYYEKRRDVKYIEKRKKTWEERFLILEKKVDIIIQKLNDKK